MTTPAPDSSATSLSRRNFLKGLGILAASALPACRRAEELTVPYRENPEWTVPGEACAYATCLPRAGGSIPLLAICHEAGPTLLQPNPRYAASSGLDARTQASLWNLYDPERCRKVSFHGRSPEEGEFEGAFAAWAQQVRNGSRIGFLFGQNPSPVRDMLVAELQRINPQARFYTHDPFAAEGRQQALDALMGPGTRQRIELENARLVLSLGCDFLGTAPLGPASAFASRLTPEGEDYASAPDSKEPRLRLIVVEEAATLTGGLAHQHLPCPHGMERFVAELAAALAPLAGVEGRGILAAGLAASPELHPSAAIARLARELWHQRGSALILLGATYPEHLHTAILALNTLLEANGGPLHFAQGDANACHSLAALADDLNANRLDTLFLLSPGDPVAEDAVFAGALHNGTAETIRLCLYEDATARASAWVLPATHYLEEWGLDRDMDGRLCLRQPILLPLCGGIAELEILSSLLSGNGKLITANNAPRHLSPAYHRVYTCFTRLTAPRSEGTPEQRNRHWEEALENGFAGEAWPRLHRLPRAVLPPLTPRQLPGGDCPVHFVADELVQTVADARNQWLAETWHPLTNLAGTPAARAFLPGLPHGALRLLRLRRAGLPDLALPVLGDESEASLTGGPHITLPLLATEQWNSFPWRHIPSVPFSAISLEALPEESGVPRRSIALFPSGKIPGIPEWNAQSPHGPGTPPTPRSEDATQPTEQWGMAIDLNICTGCNACLLACRAENNIPTVGRAELAKGRDMQWLRIDRYLLRRTGRGEHGHYRLHLPVACQQCEAAPCESVCPVNAAVHTPDGLSAMAYPRCWGTRYCAANCPYEARRFNFFDYAQASERAAHKPANPNVTVRSRGVMEKCSYCVQRINSARSKHRSALMHAGSGPSDELELRGDELILPPGAVQTACQMACPMQAITFGNLARPGGNEPETVYRAQSSPRAFPLLAHLGTRPRTAYLMRCTPGGTPPGGERR